MRADHLRGYLERYTRTIYGDNCTPLSAYIPPRHATNNLKAVLCQSSEHLDDRTDPDTGKPMSIIVYNEFKPGVDMLNFCTKQCSTRKATRRWPMRIFETHLDVGAYNAWVILRRTRPQLFSAVRRGGRTIFLQLLAKQLSFISMRDRAANGVGLQAPQIRILHSFGFHINRAKRNADENARAVCHIWSNCPQTEKQTS